MPLSLDAEYAEALKLVLPKLDSGPKPAVRDIASRRASTKKQWETLLSQWPAIDDVDIRLVETVRSYDGYGVRLHRFTKQGTGPSEWSRNPAVVYMHGGGYFSLSMSDYRPLLRTYASMSGVMIFVVSYRLSPEHPFPAPLEDCYAAVKHIHKKAWDLGVDPARIAIMGDSAGGGLCAGVAFLARRRELRPPLAKQIIINGSLDDRTVNPKSMSHLAEVATWTIEDNITSWDTYLGPGHECNPSLCPEASPGRQNDFAGLPPLYLDVPGLDILRDEGTRYARNIAAAGVEVELHVWPGVPHSFEVFAPGIALAKMAMEARVRAIKAI